MPTYGVGVGVRVGVGGIGVSVGGSVGGFWITGVGETHTVASDFHSTHPTGVGPGAGVGEKTEHALTSEAAMIALRNDHANPTACPLSPLLILFP